MTAEIVQKSGLLKEFITTAPNECNNIIDEPMFGHTLARCSQRKIKSTGKSLFPCLPFPSSNIDFIVVADYKRIKKICNSSKSPFPVTHSLGEEGVMEIQGFAGQTLQTSDPRGRPGM